MIRILGNIPNDVTVACSGGPDSMAIVDFLRKGRKNVTVAYFDHGTAHGSQAREFIVDWCKKSKVPVITGSIFSSKPIEKSLEEHWRDETYWWLICILSDIITGHHLDDCLEWYLVTSLHGNGRLIPYKRGNVIRPFLTTPKSSFVKWCDKNKVEYLNDPGNYDEKFMRPIVRHTIVPACLKVNPGLRKVIKKKVKKDYKEKWENRIDQ